MTITITIKTDNAAFEDNWDVEVNGILNAAMDWLRHRDARPGEKSLFDSNGNKVGSIVVTNADGSGVPS
jgi:hypothetical protein